MTDETTPDTAAPTRELPTTGDLPTALDLPTTLGLPTTLALDEAQPHADPRPRIRFAGIAWGVVLASAALILLATVVDPSRRRMAAEWLITLEPSSIGVILVLALGGLLVLGGVLGAVRRWQRREDAAG